MPKYQFEGSFDDLCSIDSIEGPGDVTPYSFVKLTIDDDGVAHVEPVELKNLRACTAPYLYQVDKDEEDDDILILRQVMMSFWPVDEDVYDEDEDGDDEDEDEDYDEELANAHAPQDTEPGVQRVGGAAIVVRPKQPFADYLASVSGEESHGVRADTMTKSVYFVGEESHEERAEVILKRHYGEIFQEELRDRCGEEYLWPKDRSFRVFSQWFDVEQIDAVYEIPPGEPEDDE